MLKQQLNANSLLKNSNGFKNFPIFLWQCSIMQSIYVDQFHILLNAIWQLILFSKSSVKRKTEKAEKKSGQRPYPAPGSAQPISFLLPPAPSRRVASPASGARGAPSPAATATRQVAGIRRRPPPFPLDASPFSPLPLQRSLASPPSLPYAPVAAPPRSRGHRRPRA